MSGGKDDDRNPNHSDTYIVKAPNTMTFKGQLRRAFSQHAMTKINTIVPTIGTVMSWGLLWTNPLVGS